MKTAVIVFPGSNCDQDCLDACGRVMGWDVRPVWHRDPLPRAGGVVGAGLDLVVLPGGFSHGDYLRCGALAALSPVMDDVRRFAARGGAVLGICNGFQILCEAGLLPGALLINKDLEFHCEDVWLRVERRDTIFTRACPPTCSPDRAIDQLRPLRMPIAHREGNYFANPETLARIEGEGRVLFRYVDAAGHVTPESCPNGALNNIAGIMNEAGNVCGLMPHPERASETILGGTDGRSIFESISLSLAGACS